MLPAQLLLVEPSCPLQIGQVLLGGVPWRVFSGENEEGCSVESVS